MNTVTVVAIVYGLINLGIVLYFFVHRQRQIDREHDRKMWYWK